MWYEDPNSQITVMFLGALAVMGFIMKFVAAVVPPYEKVQHPILFWLLLCPDTHRRLRPLSTLSGVIKRLLFVLVALTISFYGYHYFWGESENQFYWRSYASAPILFLMTESLVGCVTIFWLPSGKVLPIIHNAPWRLQSLADFWGHRWNLWFSDWARYSIFKPLRKRFSLSGIFIAFGISGVLHEWVINVPLYLLFGRSLFGSMMIYFTLQALGVALEHRYLRNHSRFKRIFAGFWVIAPLPFVINEGLLRIMHLWPN